MNHELERAPGAVALGRLSRLIGNGKLTPFVGAVRSWTELVATVQDYHDRKFEGKAVLTVV